MKYFGKKQDALLNKATLSYWTNWVVNEDAAYFNEALFQKLYEQHSMKYNLVDEEYNKILPQSHNIDFLENYIHGFYQICPKDILDMVADQRVLALGTLTKETLAAIIKASEKANQELELLQKEFQKEYDKALHMLSPQGKASLRQSFHDARLITFYEDDSTLHLILALCNGADHLEDQYIKLCFLQGNVMEGSLQSSLHVWIHEELYYEEDHFELHIRFSGGDIVLQFEDIKSEHLSSYLTSDYPIPELENKEMFFGKTSDLINLGYMKQEEALKSWEGIMTEAEALEQEILYLKHEDSRGKLTIQECKNPMIQAITTRRYCYQIEFINEWRMIWENRQSMLEEPEKLWVRGKEIYQYIDTHLLDQLDLWIIWSDYNNNIQYESKIMEDFTLKHLEDIYRETAEGIVINRCVTLIR